MSVSNLGMAVIPEDREKLKKNTKECHIFANIILPAMRNFRWMQSTCNAVLKTDDSNVHHVHKEVLSGCSDYFRALFSGCWSNTKEPYPVEVNIPSASSEALSTLIEFAYSGTIAKTLSVYELLTVLMLADRLIIPQACRLCEKQLALHLNNSNSISFYLINGSCYSPYLKSKARMFILKTPLNIWTENWDFRHLSEANLYDLLKDDNLNTNRREDSVLRIILKWIRYDTECRASSLPRLFTTVRMALCRKRCLMHIVKKYPLVRKNKTVFDTIQQWVFRDGLKTFTIIDMRYWLRRRTPQSVIFAVGGCADQRVSSMLEIYNPMEECWIQSKYQDLEHPRYYHGVISMGQYVYCLGGFDGTNTLSSVRRFHCHHRTWETVAHMQQCRCYASYTTYRNCIFAAGGSDNYKRMETCELYDYKQNSWYTIASMKKQRSDASAATCGDKIFVAGGSFGEITLQSVEMYLPKFDTWQDVVGMTSPRSGFSLLSYRSCLFAIGGTDGHKRLKTVEIWAPNIEQWSVVGRMRNERSNFLATIMDKELYIAGGFDGTKVISYAEKFDLSQFRKHHYYLKRSKEVRRLATERCAFGGCVVKGPGIRAILYEDENSDRQTDF